MYYDGIGFDNDAMYKNSPGFPMTLPRHRSSSGKSVGFWYIKEETEVPPVYVFASTSASMTATVSKPTVTSIHNSVVTPLPTMTPYK